MLVATYLLDQQTTDITFMYTVWIYGIYVRRYVAMYGMRQNKVNVLWL